MKTTELDLFSIASLFAMSSAQELRAPGSQHKPFGLQLPCTIVNVHDGDTMTARVTVDLNVRLLDCYCPEVTGPEAQEGLNARDEVRKIVSGQRCTLTIPIVGRVDQMFSFGRVLAHVTVGSDDKTLSEIIVARGLGTRERVRDGS